MTKTVLLTGATSGLGRATAIALAQQGHRVIATGQSSDKVSQLKQEHPEIYMACQLNVAIQPEFETMRRKLDEAGVDVIDTVFANAGVMLERGDLYDDRPYEEWPHERIHSRTYAVNVCGARRTAQTFLPYVRRSADGRILFTGGTLGSFYWHHHPNEQWRKSLTILHPAYSGSKAALNMEMLHFARQHPSLFVASLFPGWIETAVGGKGKEGMRPKKVDTALPHITRYLVGEIKSERTGSFIGPRDEDVPW